MPSKPSAVCTELLMMLSKLSTKMIICVANNIQMMLLCSSGSSEGVKWMILRRGGQLKSCQLISGVLLVVESRAEFIVSSAISTILIDTQNTMNILNIKMDEDASFRDEMLQVEKSYPGKRQIAYYTDLTKVNGNLLKFAGYDEHGNKLFFVFGMLQENIPLEKMHLFMIDWFDQRIPEKNGGFVIVYFNSNANSYENYMNFRGIYRTFPLKYFIGLKKLIIVHPSFAIKALDWFVSGAINKYLNDLTDYAPTLLKLKEFGIPLSKEVMDCIREDIRVIDFPRGIVPVTTKKSKIKIFHQKGQPEKSDISQVVVSHILTEFVPPKFQQKKGKLLQQYEMSEIGVPLLLKIMIMYLRIRPDFLSEEGIFRKSISIDDERQALQEIAVGNYNYIQNITNPHIVASLIKGMLGNLAQPLFPYELYNKFAHDQGKNSKIQYVKEIVHELPRVNYITLQFLLQFFIEDIIPRSASNKMTPYNIAVVLLPSLMRPAVSSIEDLLYSKKLAMVLQNIIKNFNYIFGSKEQQEAVYRQSVRDSQNKFNQALEIHP